MPSSSGTNGSAIINDSELHMTADDAAWIITNACIIFTMQTGFGLLESGSVTKKNEVNIMVKNLADIALGGLTYWMFGYGLSFGDGPGTSAFCGVGSFFLDSDTDDLDMGTVFTTFVFQLSFATTATTIVSGAMAERCNFTAYCLFSFLNTVVYCVPAGWIWAGHGFLKAMGVIDVAGSCGVHLVGGVSALVSAAMLGPRHGRYDNGTDPLPLGSPTNALLGLFVLWWGWLSFNCGSMFGVTNHRWKFAARTSVITIISSFGGGMVGMLYSYVTRHRKFDVSVLINSILSSLVAVTAGCALYHPWESLIIGTVSSFLTCVFLPLVDRAGVDDPVGAVAVHAVGGLWGMLAVGLFAEHDARLDFLTNGNSGVFKGGGFYLLGVQMLACAAIAVWSGGVTFIILFLSDYFCYLCARFGRSWVRFPCINRVIPIRMTLEHELLGADLLEHNVRHDTFVDPAMLRARLNDSDSNNFKVAAIFATDASGKLMTSSAGNGTGNGHAATIPRSDDDHRSLPATPPGGTTTGNGSRFSVSATEEDKEGQTPEVTSADDELPPPRPKSGAKKRSCWFYNP